MALLVSSSGRCGDQFNDWQLNDRRVRDSFEFVNAGQGKREPGQAYALPHGDPSPTRGFQVRHITNSGSFRLAGEFERQRALLISCQAIEFSRGVCEVVRAVAGRVAIVAVYSNEDEYEAARDMLVASGISPNSIRFAHAHHNTMWIRDYGPIALVSHSGREIAIVDADYREPQRENDEVVPLVVAEYARLPVIAAALKVDGGNFISNGQGLVITTSRILDENPGFDVPAVSEALRAYYGASQIVFLEPLANESTGHVDMFATFTSANCVVVGRYDPRDDGTNAEVLDRNAKRLAAVRLTQGRLHVRRIPMPTHNDGVWRTYTNVVYANGLLLMPVYSDADANLQRKAVATYRQLLPAWTVTPINADNLILSGGALHCVILNLGPLSAERIGLSTHHRRIAFAEKRRPVQTTRREQNDRDLRW